MVKKAILVAFIFVALVSSIHALEEEPIVYLEFKDFSKFLTELQRDSYYRNFMGSSVMKWYKNTRLGLKFPKRIKEFEEALGFSLSLKNIEKFSGKETCIWLFDIGELELLLITKISEKEYLRTTLAGSRENFGEGRIDTVVYYFKKNLSGDKEIDFAYIDGNLILSNEPHEFELFLRRLLKDREFTKWKEVDFLGWLNKPLDTDYDILLYLSPESIRNTYFTSYWFYNNKDEIKEWFDRGVITVKQEDDKIEETRIYNLVEGFTFDPSLLEKTDKMFSIVPRDADLIKISPVYGDELEDEMKRILGGGRVADSIFSRVEEMRPLCFGCFAKIREGKILPEIEEGIAVIVEKPDKNLVSIFDKFFPVNLRNNELFSKTMPDFSMEGEILLFSNGKDFFKERANVKKEGLTFYSWLNLAGFGEGYKKEIDLLKESSRWRSYEDRDFFSENIGDMINIVSSYIKSIEKNAIILNGKMEEKIIYTIE